MKISQDKFSLNDLHFAKIWHPSTDLNLLVDKNGQKKTVCDLEDYFTFLEDACPESVCEKDEIPQICKPFKL
jgi:hypothetical protein